MRAVVQIQIKIRGRGPAMIGAFKEPKRSGKLAAPVINYGSSGKDDTSARKMRAVERIQIKIRGNQR